VVASGYHRNLEGIRDSYRVLLSGPKDGLRLVRLLEERRVRWIVTDSSTEFLLTVPAAFPEFGPFADITSVRYEGHGVTDTALRWKPSAPTTLYWILEQSPKRLDTIELGDLVLRFRSEIPAGASARGETPAYRIYEVGRR
jgi:hypothetical protein